jgi:hypothetical protein
VDEVGIAIPGSERSLYAMLETSVHPVRAPNGGAFHPKVWMARFLREGEPPLIRVSVLSRNLTFDRSWDIGLTTEATPDNKRRQRESRALGDLIRLLPGIAKKPLTEQLHTVKPLTEQLHTVLESLASEVERCSFPAPEGFSETVEFTVLGAGARKRSFWQPREWGSGLLAISPFLTRGAADALAESSTGERILISRQDQLDALPEASIAKWNRVFVLSDAAASELDDASSDQPDGLHAKLVALEHAKRATWFVGSANLTTSAYKHLNVEVMAAITGGRWKKGINAFLDSGFITLCEEYRRVKSEDEASDIADAKARLESAQQALLADGALRIECASDDAQWRWRLVGEVTLPAGIQVHVWPVSLGESSARALELPVEWILPAERLTAFVAFRISVPGVEVDDIRMTMLLPASGLPDNRMNHVLRSLIDSPERFLQFLRALLGGLDGLVDWSQDKGDGAAEAPFDWSDGLRAESLLEDLVRIASREPERLEPVRRLIDDLRKTEEGRLVVNDELLAVWKAVDAAVGNGQTA